MLSIRRVKHPGKFLQTELVKQGMNQKELALRTGVSEKHISTVVNCTKGISATFGRKLEIALGSDSGFWVELQAQYDRYQVEFEEENCITTDEIEVFRNMKTVADFFVSKSLIDNDTTNAEKILKLRELLRVCDLTVIPKISDMLSYKELVKKSTNIDVYTLFAWQRYCEIKTEQRVFDADWQQKFDCNILISKMSDIKKVMFEDRLPTIVKKLRQILEECGIAFEVVPYFRGAPVSCYMKHVYNGKLIMCLAVKEYQADMFWYKIFHEIAHLINGDVNSRFIDFDTVKSDLEEKADQYAKELLVPAKEYKLFLNSDRHYYMEDIKEFSRLAGIPHWVTVARLLSDDWLVGSEFNQMIPVYEL